MSSCSHCIHISLLHRLKSVGHSAFIVFNLPMGRPSSVPISNQSAAQCGVTYRKRSLSNGLLFTENYTYIAIMHIAIYSYIY